MLKRFYNTNTENNIYELCLDEAGRGCLFGRVYVACVILPKDIHLFDCKDIKDSKKFSSKKKMNEVATYIKNNALAWNISFIENDIVDKINILQSVMKGMHESIRQTMQQIPNASFFGLIDGNYFQPYTFYNKNTETINELPYVTIEKGDNLYIGIAAASILAKTARDDYILELCKTKPKLVLYYGIDKNMGYGTKKHIQGIKEHGITKWHRNTFGLCKTENTIDID
jgi:ribonuclease HII